MEGGLGAALPERKRESNFRVSSRLRAKDDWRWV